MNGQLSGDFDKKQILFSVFVFSLLLISLFVNLGIHPLYLEEPRRAIIALEMIFKDNYIVPTEFGEFYCKKPPLYNWLIVLCYKISGSYSEFVTRIPTVLSFIGMGICLYLMGRKYVSTTFGILAGLIFLVSIDIYYYFSVLAEIDVFYSLLTLISFFTIFHYHQKRQYFLLFVITYFIAALGALTKGFPSIVFLGVSLPVFFYYNRDFKRLFSLSHFAGILTFAFVLGSYFFIYSGYNSLDCYLRDLWSQSSERTLLEKSVFSLVSHIFLFPLEVLKNVLPASFFLIFVFRKDFIKKIKENKYIEFCFYIFIANSIIYWISPGTRARYVYMLYPLVMMVFLYFYVANERESRNKVFRILVMVILIILLIAAVITPFIPQFKGLPYVIPASIGGAIIIAGFIWYYKKNQSYDLLILFLSLVVIRLIFNFTVLPSRALDNQQAQIEKEDAKKIAEIVKEVPIFMYNGNRVSHTSVFYIERWTRKVLGYSSQKNTDKFFIVADYQLPNEKYKVFFEFRSADERKLLVKFL